MAAATLDAFRPVGDVLEFACANGVWTVQLLSDADAVTTVNFSPEMLELAGLRVGNDPRIRSVLADLFSWRLDRQYRRRLLRILDLARSDGALRVLPAHIEVSAWKALSAKRSEVSIEDLRGHAIDSLQGVTPTHSFKQAPKCTNG